MNASTDRRQGQKDKRDALFAIHPSCNYESRGVGCWMQDRGQQRLEVECGLSVVCPHPSRYAPFAGPCRRKVETRASARTPSATPQQQPNRALTGVTLLVSRNQNNSGRSEKDSPPRAAEEEGLREKSRGSTRKTAGSHPNICPFQDLALYI